MLNACEEEVLEHTQQQKKNRIYNLGETVAMMNIGKHRFTQEDSILVTRHKDFTNKEMLLVADGMGGMSGGGAASNVAAKEMYHWFQKQDLKTLNDIAKLKEAFRQYLPQLDSKIGYDSFWGGTTLVTAFINEEAVLFGNVGDSRAYTYDGNNLKQITVDHTEAQDYYKQGLIKNIDDVRFHKLNHILTSWLGDAAHREIYLDFYEEDLKNVEGILLCSDGISDCISFEDLEKIIKTDGKVCEDIINYVLTHDSINENLDHYFYNNEIPAGKDNASVVYRKKYH